MGRELLLLRHGKSDHQGNIGDLQRPLKNRGKRNAQRMGVWLQQQDIIPDLILSSTAERALVTAEKCCKSMGLATDAICTDDTLYLSNIKELLAALAGCDPTASRVMLVGHSPGLEELLVFLVGESCRESGSGKLMPTATLAQIKMPDDWSSIEANDGVLVSLIRGKNLPDKFPYPMPDGTQLRDRPAYYYTQSGVIPFRVIDKKVEFLLVGSSSKKHWIVPKGIAEPGLSLQQSALKEAREEAGIEGVVEGGSLGTYRYLKWGAECVVTLFAMNVDKQLPESEWQEHYRGRRWMNVEAATEIIKQKELLPFFEMLATRIETKDAQ